MKVQSLAGMAGDHNRLIIAKVIFSHDHRSECDMIAEHQRVWLAFSSDDPNRIGLDRHRHKRPLITDCSLFTQLGGFSGQSVKIKQTKSQKRNGLVCKKRRPVMVIARMLIGWLSTE